MSVLLFAGLNGEGWALWCLIMAVGCPLILARSKRGKP